MDELKSIALLDTTNQKRSVDAAFEYSMQAIDAMQICAQNQTALDQALELLLKAAASFTNAAAEVGTLYTAFGKELPSHARSQELDWLSSCTVAGYDTARRRLQSVD